MDDFYATGSDPYEDPATGILKNKLGITDQESLNQAEIELVTPEILRLTLDATWGVKRKTFVDFCQIHYELFGEIYDWAGKVRSIEIAKGDTRFCKAEHINSEARRIFNELKEDNYLSNHMTQVEYAAKLAHYYSELNVLHPFREGNGRAIRTFLSIFAYESRSMDIAWDKVTPTQNIDACIEAYQGNEKSLANLLNRIISKVDQ